MRSKSMFCKEYFWQILVTIGGLFVIIRNFIDRSLSGLQRFGYIF